MQRGGDRADRRVAAAYGSVNGIIHAAGVICDSFLLKKTAEEAGAVLSPKVLGVANLDHATADLTLEFMVLFCFRSGGVRQCWAGGLRGGQCVPRAVMRRIAMDGQPGERFGPDGVDRLAAVARRRHADGCGVGAATSRGERAAAGDGKRAAGVLPGPGGGDDEIAVLSGEVSLLRAHLSGCERAFEPSPSAPERRSIRLRRRSIRTCWRRRRCTG